MPRVFACKDMLGIYIREFGYAEIPSHLGTAPAFLTPCISIIYSNTIIVCCQAGDADILIDSLLLVAVKRASMKGLKWNGYSAWWVSANMVA